MFNNKLKRIQNQHQQSVVESIPFYPKQTERYGNKPLFCN